MFIATGFSHIADDEWAKADSEALLIRRLKAMAIDVRTLVQW